MRTEDVVYSLFIVIVFLVMYAYGISIMSTTTIRNNWDKYKCNPAYMPFSQQIKGVDPEENMASCMKDMSGDAMQYVLEPVEASIDVINVLFKTITTTMTDLQGFASTLAVGNADMFSSAFGTFGGLTDMFSSTTDQLLDAVYRTSSIATVLQYMSQGVTLTSESLFNALCFHPDTLVTLQDGTKKYMKELVLGDIIENGSIVEGTLRLNNKDKNGMIKNRFYKIQEELTNQPIYVTGEHLVLDKKINRFLRVENYDKAEKTDIGCEQLVCLITSDHRIVIGNEEFWDWEDEWFYK
jgi:hypothetical protein